MATKLVNVRIPDNLYSEGKQVVEEAGYANYQEFIKDSIRSKISEIKKDKALINLEKSFESTKGKKRKPLTKEIKDKIAREHTPRRARELMKKVGL